MGMWDVSLSRLVYENNISSGLRKVIRSYYKKGLIDGTKEGYSEGLTDGVRLAQLTSSGVPFDDAVNYIFKEDDDEQEKRESGSSK